MQERMDITEVTQPKAFKAMLGLEAFLAQSSISKKLNNLMKIYASNINGCAYCIDMHSKEALDHGESIQRILLVSAWREASKFFTEEEQTALTITEEITLIHQAGVRDETYARARACFTPDQIAEIIMAVVAINAWNRLAISTHKQIEA